MIKSIALFDFTFHLSVAFHVPSNVGGPNQAASQVMQQLSGLRKYADRLIVCLDKRPYFRTELYPEYKAGRERLPEWGAIYANAMELLALDNYSIASAQGFEADDVMATLAADYYAQCDDIRLITEDKDAYQLLNDRVRLHKRLSNGEYEVRDLDWLAKYEKFGAVKGTAKKPAAEAVKPAQVPLLQAIMGDTGDNIPGVAGIGPVTGAELIRKCWHADGALKTIASITEAMIRAKEAGDMVGKVPAVVLKWLAGAGAVGGYLQLTTLRTDVPLDAAALLERAGAASEPVGISNDVISAPRAPYTAANIPPDATLDAIDEEIISGPRQAPQPQDIWLEFRSLLGGASSANLAGLEPENEYRKELTYLYRTMRDGGTRPPKVAAEDAYKVAKTPGQKALDKALPQPSWNEQRAADKKAMSAEADKVIPLPSQKVNTSPPKAPASGSAKSSASPAPSAPLPVASGGDEAFGGGGLAFMRSPFPDSLISKLPKGTKAQNDCPPGEKRSCAVCGGWHHPKIPHLDYVGHAAITDRLLSADIGWNWEPLAFTPDGLPQLDQDGGLWIRLTVCGVTRLGYGSAAQKQHMDVGSRTKELIGDALRNAAMRFGAALDLWSKVDLHAEDDK